MRSRKIPHISANVRPVVMLAILMLGLAISISTHAQVAGGTLSGVVTDPSGGVIVGADVFIKNTGTAVARSVKTDSAGFYTAPNLLPGNYEVRTVATGFSTVVESNVVLTVATEQVLNIRLEIGQSSQEVRVTAAESTVELATSALGDVVNGTTVRELPLNGRDWTQLAVLQPGVLAIRTQISTSSSTSNRASRGFGNMVSAVGHRPYENNYRVNGMSVVDYANSGPGSVAGGALGVDAIQEFSVLTTDYGAEYGRTSGGIINAITKSGTNQYHGSAYWFLRDEGLDAKNYFDNPLAEIPRFHRNQFGSSFGGPIRKNKVFIFADYEGIRQSQGLTFSDTVPSAAARSGHLCSIPTGCTPTTIQVDPLVAPFLGFYPLPNGGSIGNGDVGVYNATGNATLTEDYASVRGDVTISKNDSLAASSSYDRAPFIQPDALVASLAELYSLRLTAEVEETHVFSPTFLNTVRVAYSHSHGEANEPVSAINPLAADPSLAAIPGRFAPILTVPGLTTMTGSLGAAPRNSHHWNSYQFYDDAFLTRGAHSLKFGFSFERMQYNLLSRSKENGSFKFPSLAGFLENTPTSVQLLDPDISGPVGTRQSIFAGYIQDDWRIRPNLTLNLGLRYEPVTLPTNSSNDSKFETLTSFTSVAPVSVNTLWASNATLRNFEPRVGLAWDPFGAGKTAVRASFGIFDILPINWEYTVPTASSLPFALNVQVGKLPPGSFPTGALAFVGFDPAKAQVRFVEQHPKNSYAMNWNFNVQQEITPSLTMMIGYVGSHTLHNAFASDEQNNVIPTMTPAGFLWPFPVGSGTLLNPNVGQIRATLWDDDATYNGLLTELTKNLSHGFQAKGSYTWGKCIDMGSGGQSGDIFTNSLTSLLFFSDAMRRGPCDFDIRQNFVANFVWNIPQPKFREAAVSNILSGWQLDGIYTVSTGTPFTVLMAGDPLGENGSDPLDYPDRLTGSGCANPINPGNPSNYLKLNCFSPAVAPASFAPVCQQAAPSVAAVIPNTCLNLFGNAGRNRIYGPGLSNFDFSVVKNTAVPRISETFAVQFRAELFNIFNHPNFQSPLDNTVLFNQNGTSVGGAGRIDSTTTPSREIQLGLKVIW
jgi:carboxypeptidase family protein/TonB-dependent receptor-like protein